MSPINADNKRKPTHSTNNQWWLPVVEAFDGVSLNGLTVICPRCKEPGLAITRWVKGPTLKPIYILHFKRKKVRKVCELTEVEAKEVRTKVKVLESDIKNLLSSRKSFILFSGGLDSLCTLLYLDMLNKNINSDLTAIYVDTTVGLSENTGYVKQVCEYLGVNLQIVRPKTDYFTLARKWGIPSFKYRWCCRELKIKPIKEYLNSIKESKVVFDGIRAAESNIRRQYIPIWYHPTFKCLSISTIFHWTDEEVIQCVNNNGIPKTFLHSLGTSTECWCGVNKTEADFKKLYNLDRDMFYKLSKLEEGNKNGYTFLYKKGQKIPLRELEKQFQEGETDAAVDNTNKGNMGTCRGIGGA